MIKFLLTEKDIYIYISQKQEALGSGSEHRTLESQSGVQNSKQKPEKHGRILRTWTLENRTVIFTEVRRKKISYHG